MMKLTITFCVTLLVTTLSAQTNNSSKSVDTSKKFTKTKTVLATSKEKAYDVKKGVASSSKSEQKVKLIQREDKNKGANVPLVFSNNLIKNNSVKKGSLNNREQKKNKKKLYTAPSKTSKK